MEETAKQSEKALEELNQLTVDVNRERKNSQVSSLHVSLVIIHYLIPTFIDCYRGATHGTRDTVDRANFNCAAN